jgi:hypothetical protein
VPLHAAAPATAALAEGDGNHAAVAVLLGVVALLAASAIGFFLWRAKAPAAHPTAIVATASATATANTAPLDTAITIESVEPVVFAVTPDSAVLIVDGVEQAPGVRSVTRKPGQSITVIVRAPEHEDAQVQVDDLLVNKTVAIKLTPVRKHRDGKRTEPLPANPY